MFVFIFAVSSGGREKNDNKQYLQDPRNISENRPPLDMICKTPKIQAQEKVFKKSWVTFIFSTICLFFVVGRPLDVRRTSAGRPTDERKMTKNSIYRNPETFLKIRQPCICFAKHKR